ncbi:MAG: hypothetical protein LPD71_06500, partial [Shewanella sp.]|nr:hypothetical protein [Shewanella sp.]
DQDNDGYLSHRHIVDGDTLHLRGLVGNPDGSEIIRGEISGPTVEFEQLGIALADELLGNGAKSILDAVYSKA